MPRLFEILIECNEALKDLFLKARVERGGDLRVYHLKREGWSYFGVLPLMETNAERARDLCKLRFGVETLFDILRVDIRPHDADCGILAAIDPHERQFWHLVELRSEHFFEIKTGAFTLFHHDAKVHDATFVVNVIPDTRRKDVQSRDGEHHFFLRSNLDVVHHRVVMEHHRETRIFTKKYLAEFGVVPSIPPDRDRDWRLAGDADLKIGCAVSAVHLFESRQEVVT